MRASVSKAIVAAAVGHAINRSVNAVYWCNHLLAERAQDIVDDQSMDEALNLWLLFPVLAAPDHVESSWQWYSALDWGPNAVVTTVYITTEREGSVAENATAQMAEKIVASVPEGAAVRHLHSERQPYSKAAQLNYALDTLPMGPDDYVIVYDIDGRLEPSGPLTTVSQLQSLRPQIAQQCAATVLEPDPPSTPAARADAQSHLVRLFHNEVGGWNRYTNSLNLPWPHCPYCVGNGLIIRRDTLDEMGGFPEPVDDIGVGFRASFAKIPIVTLPVLVAQERYSSARHMIKSKRFISQGTFTALGELRSGQRRSVSALLTAVVGMMPALRWLLSPGIVIAGWLSARRLGVPGRALAAIAALVGVSVPPSLAGAYIDSRVTTALKTPTPKASLALSVLAAPRGYMVEAVAPALMVAGRIVARVRSRRN